MTGFVVQGHKCAVHIGNGVPSFFPVKHHSHIGFKLPVNSLASLTRNDLCLYGVVFVNMKGYTRSVFLLMFSFLCQTFTFMLLLLGQRHRIT